jgi:signal recognition particle subunit SRP54
LIVFKRNISHSTVFFEGALSAKDVSVALREVRRALIEADVALDIVRSFIKRVQDKAVGAEIIRSIKPGELVVKIVHDELIEMLGHEAVEISLKASAPVVLMMVGLQGSGKTTTTAKLARSLTSAWGAVGYFDSSG